MATTLPEVFNNSTLPFTTKAFGATNPLTESRSSFRTTTFLWVEGIGLRLPHEVAQFREAGPASPLSMFRHSKSGWTRVLRPVLNLRDSRIFHPLAAIWRGFCS